MESFISLEILNQEAGLIDGAKEVMKILFWDKNGFWLYYRRLDSGTFNWPSKANGKKTMPVMEQQLS